MLGVIDVIDAQLCAWGKSQMRQLSRGCGFPPWSPMFRDSPSGKGDGGNPTKGLTLVSSADLRDVGAAVRALGVDDRQLVAETYIVGGPRRVVAQRMSLPARTYYDRLHALHVRVQSALHVMSVGA